MVKRDLNFSDLLQTSGLQNESDLNPSLWSKTAEQYFLDPVSKNTTKQDKQVTFKTPVQTKPELQDTTNENLYINPNEINSPKNPGGDHTYESLTQLQTKTKPFEIVPKIYQNESHPEDMYDETIGFRRNRNRMLSRNETPNHTDISSSNINNKNLSYLKNFDKYELLRLPGSLNDAYIDVGELSQNNDEESPYIVQKTPNKSVERDTYIEFEKYQNFVVDRNMSMTKTLQKKDLERDKGIIEVFDYEVPKQLDDTPLYDSKRVLGKKLSKDNIERNFSNNTDKESNQEFKSESAFTENINSPCQYGLHAAIKGINVADKEQGHRLDAAVESGEFINVSDGTNEEFESCNEFISDKQDFFNPRSTQVAQNQNSSSNNSDSETKGNSNYEATLGASEEVLYDTPYTSSKDEPQEHDSHSQTLEKPQLKNAIKNHKSKELLEEISNSLLSKSTVNMRSESLDEKMDRWCEYSTRFTHDGLEQEDYQTSYPDREFVKKGDKINRNFSTQTADTKMKHYGATNALFHNASNNIVSIKTVKNVPENTSTSKSVVCRERINYISNESKHLEVSEIKSSLNQLQAFEEPSHIKVDTLEDDYSSSNEKEESRNWNHGDQMKASNQQRYSNNTSTKSSSGSHEGTRATNAESSSTATAMATMKSSYSIYRMIPLLFDEPIPESRTSLIIGTSRNSFTIPENERRSWDGSITPTNCESDNMPKDCEKEESLLFVPAKREITEDICLEGSENASKFDQSKNKERARSKTPLVRMLTRVARAVQKSGSKPKDFKNDLVLKQFDKNIVQLVNASEKQAKTRIGLPDISSKKRESQARDNAEVLNVAEISNTAVHGRRETDVIKVETKTETQRNPQPNYKAIENLSKIKKSSLKKVTFSPDNSMSSFSSTNHPISINDPVEGVTKNQGVINSKIRKEQSSKELATLASFNNCQKSLQHECSDNIKNVNQAPRNNENNDGNQIGHDSSVKIENKSVSIQDSKHGKNKKTLDVSDNAGQTQQLTDTINATKPHHCISGSCETSSSSLGIASMFKSYSSWNIHASFDEKTQRQCENQETVIKKSHRVDVRGQKTGSNIESMLFVPIKSGATKKNLTYKKEHAENSKVVDNAQTLETLDNSFFQSEFKECHSNDFKENNSGNTDHGNGTFSGNSFHDKELIEGKLSLQEKNLGKPLQSTIINKDIESGSGCQPDAGSTVFPQEDLSRKQSPHDNLDFQTLENVKDIEENIISNEENENKLNSFSELNKKRYTEKFESQDHKRKKHKNETLSNSVQQNGQVHNYTKVIENRPLKKSFAKRFAKVFNRPNASEKHIKEIETQKVLQRENMQNMQEVLWNESIKKVKDPKKIKQATEDKQVIIKNTFSSKIPVNNLVGYKKEELIANEKVEGGNEFNDITPTANRVDVSASPLFEKQANDNMKEMKKSTRKFWKKVKKCSSKEYLPPSILLTNSGHQKVLSQTSNPARQLPKIKVLEVPIMKPNTKERDGDDIKIYNLSNETRKPNDNPVGIPGREVNVSVISGNMKQKDLSKQPGSNNETNTCKIEAKTSMKESTDNVTLTRSFGTRSSTEVFQNDSHNPCDLSLRNIPLPSHSMVDACKIDIQLENSNFSENNEKVNVYNKLDEKLNKKVNSNNSLAKIPATPEPSVTEQTKVSNLIPSLPKEEETLLIRKTNGSPTIENSKCCNSDEKLTSEDTNQYINQVRDLIKGFVVSKLLKMQRNPEFTVNQHNKKEMEVISSLANELSSFFDIRNIGNPEAYFTDCITVPDNGDSLQVNAAESQQSASNISKTDILPEYTYEKKTSNPNIAADSINRLLMQSIASLYEKRSNDLLYDTSHTFNDIEKSIPSKPLSSNFSVVLRNSYDKLIPKRSSGIKRKTLHENLIYSILKAKGDATPERLVSKRVRQLQSEQISPDGRYMRHYRKKWKPLPTKLISKTSITRSKELRKGHQKSATDVHESLLPKESSYTFDLDKLFDSSSHSASSELLETSSSKINQKTSTADWMSIISKSNNNNVEKVKKNETFTLSTSLSTTEESLESVLVSQQTKPHPDETERKDFLNVSKYLATSPSNEKRIVTSDELESDENKENIKIKTGIEKLKEIHKHIPLKTAEKNIKKGSQSNMARLRMIAKVARAVNRLSSGVKDCQESWKDSEKDQNQPEETRNIFMKSEESRTDTESEQNNTSNKESVNVKSFIVDFLDEDVNPVKKEMFHINSSQGLVSKSKDISNELINSQTLKTTKTKKVKRKISQKAISSSSSEKTHVLNLNKDGKAITNFWHTLKRKSSEELFVFVKSKPRQESKSLSNEANTKSLHPKSSDGTLYLSSKKESNIKTIWPPFSELDYSVAKELSDEIRQQLTNSLMEQRVENDIKQRSMSILTPHPALTKKHRKLSVTHHRKKEMEPLSSKRQYQLKNEQVYSVGKSVNQQQQVRKIKNPSDTGQLLRTQEKTEDERKHNFLNDHNKCQNLKGSHITSFDSNTPETENSQLQRTDIYKDKDDFNELHAPVNELSPSLVYPPKDESISKSRHCPNILFHANSQDNSTARGGLNIKQPLHTSDLHERANSKNAPYLEQQLSEARKLLRPIPLPKSYEASWERASPKTPAPPPMMRQYGLSIAQELPEALKKLRSTSVPQQPVPNKCQNKEKINTHPLPLSEDRSAGPAYNVSDAQKVPV